ncbi:small CPxCG-related zinc finger protein [Natrialba magadii ATCC 43099]|uniref:Small CPxCG-related zinc finger protein n=1 Tax=Natrialba magadii (strain ATCC 43099 / DSM 3394 / CCM 3739 / CIP 104546 / IAM 13178 / JCM 8861 / NBRC 102185 / NCIMB 2190 / MS3) TaxID=547559 RepID=D3ST28_NATMM|nr:HVO_0416 family zinc finger protein [Natrialba magadii]ADD04974.1 small CPxCG-related zinc finger protein [Natrialba magadii ATCC 43099]ELY24022.1 hypothetical protein C500_19500 [Natrialba magadii ATCC 43099]
MASAPNGAGDDVFDQFLTDRGHTVERLDWEVEYNKKQCPECSGLHDLSASTCTVCGWEPTR